MVVVAHSHWDREWYAPFESYRLRLIDMMDQLIDLLDSDPAFTHFHLDGQVAMVDDYLDARPEAEPALKRLVGGGRLAIGPWYVLMDEFCVSAETIVRNLQKGLAAGARLGDPEGRAWVGYLPDMFGHVAQMPQILRQAGLNDAVVWRGVPAAITNRAFGWVAPDGSRVRAEYLPVGYASGAVLPKDSAGLLRRMAAHEQEISAYLGPTGDLLLMNGGDHQRPQPWLPALLDTANREQDHFVFRQSSLAAFLAARTDEDLPTWTGELRSGARAPLLMGVLSNRVDVKQAAAAAEAALERWAEPLATLWLPASLWPDGALERAWTAMIDNSAHDSICACSADEVVRAVLHRYDSAAALAADVADSALAIAGVAIAGPGPLVVNSLPFERGGVIEVDLPGVEAPAGTQQLARFEAGCVERSGTGADLGRLLAELAASGWLGASGRGVAARIGDAEPEGSLTVTLEEDAARPTEPAMAPVMAEAWARAGAGRDRPLTVRVERAASQRVAARVEAVPGWGWAQPGWVHPGWAEPDRSAPGGSAAGGSAPDRSPPGGAIAQVVVTEGDEAIEVDNGRCRVRVDRASGGLALDGLSGLNRIVEEGDEGDTYNWSPAGRAPVDTPTKVEIEVLERGPVRSVVRTRRWYRWDTPTEVISDIDVRSGEAVVRVTTSFDHTGRDHRVRAMFPLGRSVAGTEAECAFATVVRSGAEGGPAEPALATFPSRRFVTAGPLTITHQGLLEHELVEDGSALAVTLLRAVGILARPAPPARPNVAGPPVPLRDAQLPGPHVFRYALARHAADPWALADATWTPLIAMRSEGAGHLPDRGQRLRLSGARVSALRRRGGRIEIRVFNPGPEPTTVELPGHAGQLIDLRDRVVAAWRGSFRLGPWAFATARLDAVSLD